MPFHSRIFINTLQMQARKTRSLLWGQLVWDRRYVGPRLIHHPTGMGKDQICSQRWKEGLGRAVAFGLGECMARSCPVRAFRGF